MSIGARFRQLMQEHGYTQTSLMRAVNSRISQAAIWKIVNDKTTPTTATLRLLAPAFGMTFAELAMALGMADVPPVAPDADQQQPPPAEDGQHERRQALVQAFRERNPEAEAILAQFIERTMYLDYTDADLAEALQVAELILAGKRQMADAETARRDRRAAQ